MLCAVPRGVTEKEITIPKSSTTHALVNMTQNWLVNTDGNGDTARVVLLDLRKASDLIDYSVLIQKLATYDVPSQVKSWIVDFLMDWNRNKELNLLKIVIFWLHFLNNRSTIQSSFEISGYTCLLYTSPSPRDA